MPTGYTADILDGKVTNASEFAQVCARAFMINMRDTPWDAPLRMPERYDSHYAKELPLKVAELAKWDVMTDDEKYDQWRNYADEQEKYAAKCKAECEKNARLLMKIRDQIAVMRIPETHRNFHNFMIEQIDSTLDFDGTFDAKCYAVVPYDEWVESHRASIIRSIEINTEGLAKAEKNYRTGTEWVATLAALYDLDIKD